MMKLRETDGTIRWLIEKKRLCMVRRRLLDCFAYIIICFCTRIIHHDLEELVDSSL